MAGEPPPDPHLAEWMSKVDTKLDTIAEACKKLLVSSEGQSTAGPQRGRFPCGLRVQSTTTMPDIDIGRHRRAISISSGTLSRNSSQEREWRQELLERSRNIMGERATSQTSPMTPMRSNSPRNRSKRSLFAERPGSSSNASSASIAHRPSLAVDRLSGSDRPTVRSVPSVAEEAEERCNTPAVDGCSLTSDSKFHTLTSEQERCNTPAVDGDSLTSDSKFHTLNSEQDQPDDMHAVHTRSVGFRGELVGAQDIDPPRTLTARSIACAESPRATMRSLTEITEKVKGFSKVGSYTSGQDAADQRLSERLERRLNTWSHETKIIRGGVMSRFVMSQQFDCAVLLIILFNALLIGAQVHYSAISDRDENWVFDILELICTGIFTAELGLRLAVMGRTFFTNLEERWWNMFDATLVGMSLVDIVLSRARSDRLPDSSLSGLGRIIRIMRILRIIRTVRFLGHVRILMKMIFMNSLQSLFWIMLILAGIIYSFSIVLTQAATEYRRRDEPPGDLVLVRGRFGSLFESMYTLFQCITGGVSWGEVSVLMRGPGWVMEAIVILYVFFTVFAVNNIVNGVFVDGAIELAKRDRASVVSKQKADDAAHETCLMELLRAIDEDEDGFITFDEFCEALEKPNMKNYIAALNVEISDARRFFALLDESNDGVVGVAQFVTGMMKLRGEAKNADIHMMMHENHMLTRMVTGLVDLIGESMAVTQQPLPLSYEEHEQDEQPRVETTQSQLLVTSSSLKMVEGSRERRIHDDAQDTVWI